jgi:hypothetical protein
LVALFGASMAKGAKIPLYNLATPSLATISLSMPIIPNWDLPVLSCIRVLTVSVMSTAYKGVRLRI